MDPGDMRRVEQIVDDVKIMAGDIHAAAGGPAPGRVVIIRNLDDAVRVCRRLITHPDPQDPPAINHRIGSDSHTGRRRPILCRCPHTGAAAVEGQAMIAALDRLADESPL